jgi:O-antigen/teichoic acid export membrane protein
LDARPPEESHAKRRQSQLLKAALSASLTRPFVLVCSLAQTPIALHGLDKEGFGFWVTLTAILNTLAAADFGLGLGMQNRVSHLIGTERPIAAQRLFSMVFLSLVALGAAFFLILLPFVLRVDWASVFKLSDPSVVAGARWCVLFSLFYFAASIPLTSAQRLAAGMQLSWAIPLFNALASVVALALVAAAVFLRLNILPVIAAGMLPLLASNIGLYVLVARKTKWRFAIPERATWTEFPAVAKAGFLFFIPQIGSALLFAAPPFILASILGSAAVTPLNLGQRLTGVVVQVSSFFLAPLWPAYADASARKDAPWIRSTFLKSIWITLVAAAMCCFVTALFGPTIITLWVNRPADAPDSQLMMLLSAWTFLMCIGQCVASFLNGLGVLRGQSIYGFATAIVGLALLVPFVERFGVHGLPASLLVAYLFINAPGAAFETFLTLRRLGRS